MNNPINNNPQSTREFLRELKKEGDEYTMKYLVRPLSVLPTLLLVRYTNITPNQVSLFAFLLAVIGSIFLFLGGYWYQLIGVLFAYLYVVFDCVDGNIARVKKLKSLEGRWLDAIGGFIVTPLLLFALLWGMKNPSLFVFGSLAMLAYPMQYLIVFFYKSRIIGNNDPLPIAFGGTLEKLRYAYGSALFFPVLAFAVIFQQVYFLLWFYAVVGNLVWVFTLGLQYREIKKKNNNS